MRERPSRTGSVRQSADQAAEAALELPESPDEEPDSDEDEEDSALADVSLLAEEVSAELLELDVLSVR